MKQNMEILHSKIKKREFVRMDDTMRKQELQRNKYLKGKSSRKAKNFMTEKRDEK